MAIKVVHTADNHVDLKYSHYPERAQSLLRRERIDALGRVVREANNREADVLVVAGDLFDREGLKFVTVQTVKQVVEELSAFSGDRVLVLPGNHDHCAGGDSDLWNRMREEISNHPVFVLDSPTVHRCEIGGHKVEFYPCPCTTKTSESHVMGWVKGTAQDQEAIRIGIAHGNVEGLGVDDHKRYFNMTESDLASAGMHTWLLGHIHRPSPESSGSGGRAFFMAGSTTPESFHRNGAGTAWYIEIGANGVERYEQFQTGAISFHEFTRKFSHRDGPEAILDLEGSIARLSPEAAVLGLKLDGELGADELKLLAELVKRVSEGPFIHTKIENIVKERLSRAMIEREYPDNTNASRLLKALLESESGSDARVALDAIRELDQLRAIKAGTRGR